ncbi:DsbA-like protein [Ancylostoma ceylanicum]|uniref:Glutathione S-transferase kappa n=1 Tax=Ancylostoma ceylanicum TaxID=53326 RepID=A0A0D6LQZ5_9BILA|nr:DsbA-like protein [Ancylostoma ceylanicum]
MAISEQKVQVDLYYDVISPYAWIAFESLLRYENVWPIKVNLKPFSLRGVMQESGNRPPGFVPAKSMYMLKDLERNNAYWNMKLKPPKSFMKWIKTKSSDNAMKLLLVVQKEQPGCSYVFELRLDHLRVLATIVALALLNPPNSRFLQLCVLKIVEFEKLESVSREFWKRIWTRGEPIFEREDFEQVLLASGVSNTAHYIDKIADAAVEHELQKNTSDAIDSGVGD